MAALPLSEKPPPRSVGSACATAAKHAANTRGKAGSVFFMVRSPGRMKESAERPRAFRRPAHRINGDGSLLLSKARARFNPVTPRWRRAEREATRTRSVPRGHDSAPPAHQNGECAPCWILPAPCRESPPHPRQGPKGDIPTAMARGLGLRERRKKRPPNAGASGPGGPGVERGSRRRRLKRRLVGGWSRRWRRRGRGRGSALPWRSCMRAWRCSMRAWRS